MIKFGLCCIFLEQPIKFHTTTATFINKLDRKSGLNKISNLIVKNLQSLLQALQYCKDNSIGAFRVTSRIFPLKTHPKHKYAINQLSDHDLIIDLLHTIKCFSKENNIRTSFHPDQFVVLSSDKDQIIQSSLNEIEYQCEVADAIGADVVNIHVGGTYGNKSLAVENFKRNFNKLSDLAKNLLTLENDDKSYNAVDLLSLCYELQVPFVYDIHHHRCNKDYLTEEEVTKLAMTTWKNKIPLFHISSPLNGWGNAKESSHHDYIDVNDFPKFWINENITIDIEAKSKELAIIKLREDLERVNI